MAGPGNAKLPPGRKPAARNRGTYLQTVPAPSAKTAGASHGRTSTHAHNHTDEWSGRPRPSQKTSAHACDPSDRAVRHTACDASRKMSGVVGLGLPNRLCPRCDGTLRRLAVARTSPCGTGADSQPRRAGCARQVSLRQRTMRNRGTCAAGSPKSSNSKPARSVAFR
jgi:hypothetical protein